MLQIDQIKALLADGLHVYRGTPSCTNYRTVWLEKQGNIDGSDCLLYAHPADEVAIEGLHVETPEFNPADYMLHSDNHYYGGHFHNMRCWEFEETVVTKVIKFTNPRPPREGFRQINHYVVIDSEVPLTDEDACERAIDLVLALGAGFDGDTAKPVLVI